MREGDRERRRRGERERRELIVEPEDDSDEH